MAKLPFENYEIKVNRMQLMTAEGIVVRNIVQSEPEALEFLIPITLAFSNLNNLLYHPETIPEADLRQVDNFLNGVDEFEEE